MRGLVEKPGWPLEVVPPLFDAPGVTRLTLRVVREG
jgi:hypothetical protein